MNEYNINNAFGSDVEEIEPVEECVSGEWHERNMGKSRIVMHTTGSEMHTSAACLDDIDVEAFLPSDTYVPVSHKELVEEVELATDMFLGRHGITVTDRSFVLAPGRTEYGKGPLRQGAKMFALWGLSLEEGEGDEAIRAVFGAQNALDGTGSAVVAVGSQMFVCDNLAFSGELMKSRHHKGNVLKDVISSIWEFVRAVPEHFFCDVELKKLLRDTPIEGNDGYRVLADAAAYGCFSTMDQYKSAAKELRIPSYGVFARDHSMWRVYNACTYGVGRKSGPLNLIGNTNKVDSFFREVVGV